jgi:F0F1-type ATP synthase delta subunit
MKVSSSQYAKTLLALSDTEDAGAVATSFLALVRRNRAAKRLPLILRLFERMSDERAGRLALSVETASEAGAEARQVIEAHAGRFFPGRELSFRYEVDPELLGGARISSEDELLDVTVRQRLNELARSMR